MPRKPRYTGKGRGKANMKTTEEGEDSRPITDPPADEPTPEMERDGGDLEAHPLSTDAQTKLKVAFLYFSAIKCHEL